MGDMADFALDAVMDDEEARLDFHMGLTNIVEAYERGIVDELGRELSYRLALLIRCKYCSAPDLHWKDVERGWRLVDGAGDVHSCAKYGRAKHSEKRRPGSMPELPEAK